MTLKEIMNYKNFCVIGDTLNEEKYAYKIKNELLKNNYNVTTFYKDGSLNNIKDLEVVNLVINPVLGLKFIIECSKEIKAVLIQPGADSLELIQYLENKKIPYLKGCSLIGLKEYII